MQQRERVLVAQEPAEGGLDENGAKVAVKEVDPSGALSGAAPGHALLEAHAKVVTEVADDGEVGLLLDLPVAVDGLGVAARETEDVAELVGHVKAALVHGATMGVDGAQQRGAQLLGGQDAGDVEALLVVIVLVIEDDEVLSGQDLLEQVGRVGGLVQLRGVHLDLVGRGHDALLAGEDLSGQGVLAVDDRGVDRPGDRLGKGGLQLVEGVERVRPRRLLGVDEDRSGLHRREGLDAGLDVDHRLDPALGDDTGDRLTGRHRDCTASEGHRHGAGQRLHDGALEHLGPQGGEDLLREGVLIAGDDLVDGRDLCLVVGHAASSLVEAEQRAGELLTCVRL